jgi:hypothetical protein
MSPEVFATEWEIISRYLPPEWKTLAHDLGAIRINKGITDPSVLLRLLLLHASTGLSLQSTVARARTQKLATLSAVALFKRLRTAGPWLAALGRAVFTQARFRRERRFHTGRRVRVVDATTVQEPGPKGSDWIVHYTLDLRELACDFYAVTSPAGAETFKRVPVDAGDILLGDRGYCHRDAVAHVVERGGDVVVRLNTTSFPLCKPKRGRVGKVSATEEPDSDAKAKTGRQVFDIIEHLRTIQGYRPHSWPVRFKSGKKWYRARLCAVRKTEEAAERARAKVKRDAERHRATTRPSTFEAAGYLFVLTTVPQQELPLRDVLELYRARWQLELVFKRLKSLLRLGHLKKETTASSRAWLQAKLLATLLTERLADEAGLFSPWGHDEAAPQSVA